MGSEPRGKAASRGRGRSTASVLRGLRHGEDLRELLPRPPGHPQLVGAGCPPESAAEPLARTVRGRQAIWLRSPPSGTPPVSEVTSPGHTENLCSTGANPMNEQKKKSFKRESSTHCSAADWGWKGLPTSKSMAPSSGFSPREVGPPSYSGFKALPLKSPACPAVSRTAFLPKSNPESLVWEPPTSPTGKSRQEKAAPPPLRGRPSWRVLASDGSLACAGAVTVNARGPEEPRAKLQLTVVRGRSIFQPAADCSWWLMVTSAVAFWPSAAVTCHISVLELRQGLSSAFYTIWLQVAISLAFLPGAPPSQPLGFAGWQGAATICSLACCSCPGSVSREHEELRGEHGKVPSARSGAGPSGSAREHCLGHQRQLGLASGES